MLVIGGGLGSLGLFRLAGKGVIADGLQKFLQLALSGEGDTLSSSED